MCVYVIMLICVCILCYYVYSVKSSWELVFIVYKNQIQIKFSYLILSYLIATPNNYRIIARSGYWKYDHECRKMHQIKRVCGTCYVHKFNMNAFRHEWSYIQYSRRAIDYYIYFIDENKRYSRKFRWTTQQTTSKLGTFVNFMCVYKCSVLSQ